MEITWQTISLFVGLFAALSAVQIKAFDWLLKRNLDTLEDRFKSADTRLDKIEARLDEFQRDYVRREDWMRLSTAVEAKLDVVSARLDAIFAADRAERRQRNADR